MGGMMAHYAFLDENNLVTEVITGNDETELIEGLDPETWYGNFCGQVCKRTSYNTYGGQHNNGGVPYRKNYAGIGYTYDSELDAFYAPQPYPSWILDKDTCLWEAPVSYPADASMENRYRWSEEELEWVAV
jgi:hypothetical protein